MWPPLNENSSQLRLPHSNNQNHTSLYPPPSLVCNRALSPRHLRACSHVAEGELGAKTMSSDRGKRYQTPPARRPAASNEVRRGRSRHLPGPWLILMSNFCPLMFPDKTHLVASRRKNKRSELFHRSYESESINASTSLEFHLASHHGFSKSEIIRDINGERVDERKKRQRLCFSLLRIINGQKTTHFKSTLLSFICSQTAMCFWRSAGAEDRDRASLLST